MNITPGVCACGRTSYLFDGLCAICDAAAHPENYVIVPTKEKRMATRSDARHVELLTHMLGAGPHIKRQNHGYRNRFCAEVNSDDFGMMTEMQAAGLVVAGPQINEGRDQYFSATLAGCQAAGLSKAATKRAMAD